MSHPSFGEWLNGHLDEVARHADRWLAVDPELGIVIVADRDGDRFEQMVEAWCAQMGRGAWTFHTSSVIEGGERWVGSCSR